MYKTFTVSARFLYSYSVTVSMEKEEGIVYDTDVHLAIHAGDMKEDGVADYVTVTIGRQSIGHFDMHREIDEMLRVINQRIINIINKHNPKQKNRGYYKIRSKVRTERIPYARRIKSE